MPGRLLRRIAIACACALPCVVEAAPPARGSSPARVTITGDVLYSDAEWRLAFVAGEGGVVLIEPAEGISLPPAGRKALVEGRPDRVRGLAAVTEASVRDVGPGTMPEPAELALGQVRDPVARWGQLTGRVRQLEQPLGRLWLRLAVNGQLLEVHLPPTATPPAQGAEVDSELRLRGVLEPASDAWSLPRFWVAGNGWIEVIQPAPAWDSLPPISVAHALSLARSQAPPPGAIRLELQALERESFRSYTLGDASGRLSVAFGDADFPGAGVRCDVRGFLELRGGTPILADARWRFLGTPQAFASRRETGLPLLGSVGRVRALVRSEAERGYPVSLRGVVTYVSPGRDWLFLQDASGGVYVYGGGSPLDVQAGDDCRLDGVTAPGALAPIVVADGIHPLGRTPLPEARPLSAAALATGVADCRRVSVLGVVRSLRRFEDRFEIELAAEGRRLVVRLPLASGVALAPSLVDSTLRVRAVCGTRFNWRGLLEGVQLYVARGEDLSIEHPSPPPFELPMRPIRDVFREGDEARWNRRVRVQGTVLHWRAGEPASLRDETGTIIAELASRQPLSPGDRVEIAGFPSAGGLAPRLEDAVVRVAGRGPAPVPVEASFGRLLGGTLEAELVEIEARLLETARREVGASLLLQQGDGLIEARAPGPLPADLALQPGSRLAVSGILTVHQDPGEPEPVLRLALRSPRDIRLLARPPWWTPARAAWAVAGLAAVLLAVVAWVSTLRRQVRNQTADLARLAVAVEQAAEAIVLTDPDGTILYVNPAFERITGYPAAEAVGNTTRLLKSGVHDRPFYDALWRTIGSGKTWEGRLTNRRKDGEFFIEDASISPIRERASDRLIGYVAVKRDVTRQVQIESHLAQTQKMEAIGRLAAGVAHDFNNVLAAIVGFVDLSLRKVPPDSPIVPYLTGIRDAGLRAAGLTRQILTFSRQTSPELRPIELRPVVEEAVRLLRALLPANVEIRTRLDSSGIVAADPTQIHQVVLNLGTNGGLAMRESGGLLEITLSDQELDAEFARRHPPVRPGPHVQLEVRDGGDGMSPDVVERVFEPFFTTRGYGEGTGMGLAVVHGIVDRHGGLIRAESSPGRGAAFSVYLPAVAAGPAAGDSQAERPLPRGRERVLLVDDEPALARVGEEMLAELGYTVAAFTSPAAALERFSADPRSFDLAVVDLSMPGLAGDALARELLRLRPIPIILCSGYSERFSEPDAAALGVAAFVMKPMSLHDLAHAVRSALDGR